MGVALDKKQNEFAKAQAVTSITQQLAPYGGDGIPAFLQNFVMGADNTDGSVSGQLVRRMEKALAKSNAVSREFRKNTRVKQFPEATEFAKSNPALAKANLDVGSLTDFSQITGGQSLGYVSLDTRMARGTVRPNSFTLYNCLNKTPAFQVVDYWAYANATGGPLPGAAFSGFSSVGSGTLATNAGKYDLKYIMLKLALDGRAITVALAAQNSFVNVAEQENTNAALSVLESVNWTNYWGNTTLYPNQFNGIAQEISTSASGNIYNFKDYATATSSKGWSAEQTLFNLIYEAAAEITSYRQYGQITHAFMSPSAMGGMQTLVTGLLNNIVNDLSQFQEGNRPMVVNGDLQGMNTRFGDIQFPIDLFITARDKPAQSVVYDDGTNAATTTSPTKPATVTVAASGGAYAGSDFDATYVSGSAKYVYAVASCDDNMNESTLTFSAVASGISAGSAYTLTIAPPAAADATVFRVYRSGLGDTGASTPTSVRFIGEVAANGSSNVTFVDDNTHIPGSETIFLLDMDEQDDAIDFRYLLPLTKIELFAQNLYMPWAVAAIGAIRVKIPKFHGYIKNVVLSNASWNPLGVNA